MKMNRAFGIIGVTVVIPMMVIGCKKQAPVETEPVIVETEPVKKDTDIIRESVNKMYETGGYSSAQIANDMSLDFYFNTNGGAYVESPYTVGLYLDKEHCLMANSNNGKPYFELYNDITPVHLVEIMCDYADKGLASITKDGDTLENGVIYNITTSGANIYDVFSTIGKEYADDKLSMYKCNNSGELTTSDKLNVTVAIEPDNLATAAEIVLKNESKEPYVMWVMDGYIPLGSWDMDMSYWTVDMDTSDYKEVEGKLEDIQKDVSDKITNYLGEHPELASKLEENIESSVSNESSVDTETESEVETDNSEVETESSEVETDNSEVESSPVESGSVEK